MKSNGEIDEIKLNQVLRTIDKPYYKDSLQSSYQQFAKEHSYISEDALCKYGDKILGLYFKNIMLRQDKDKSYADSENDDFIHQTANTPKTEKEKIQRRFSSIIEKEENEEKIINVGREKFEVTQEIIDMFGEGYTKQEYRKMVKKYNDMSKTYVVQTNLHKEALLTYVRFKVKEETATAKGDVQDAQKWYSAAQDAAEKAKLTPRQLSKEDLQGGMVNFSDIFTAVESAKERIKIFPEFKYQPRDAADFIIWNYVNYERNLNNMPEVPYSDIYKFYDEKKKEYIEMHGDPYGIFTEDTTESNRETIERFITIPSEFRDGE